MTYRHPSKQDTPIPKTPRDLVVRKMVGAYVPDNVALIAVKATEEFTGGAIVDFAPSDKSGNVIDHRVDYGASKYGSECSIVVFVGFDIDVDGSVVIRSVEHKSTNNIDEAGTIDAWIENKRKARAARKNIK